ncbi:hypothetical protein NIE79_005179 [Micromonospora sp. NIE79]|uniref:Uncharacterized protein n=1 Tax=Micromonospora trifolii TaxID=2911208 RepID=A0ABS9N936_9ACTN|nr:hypothetical protein [Micromonospora trifolii]MCG5446480.1 hypothetical protein [Micromonospora trifolii]
MAVRPADLNEGCDRRGAEWWATSQAVAWEVVKPTLGLLALLRTIWSLRRLELIWVITMNGPVGATETVVTAIERHPFTPHPLRMFQDAVFDIRPRDERSFFNLEGDS